MTQPFVCPFCGQPGQRTKEHVWAQWLHQTEGAKELLKAAYGERIPKPDQVLRRGLDGRYEMVKETSGAFAKWLPNLTVPVCAGCNNGWMSALEDATKSTLGPFVFDKRTLKLSADDLRLLATWATKSWMAYALTRPQQQNPFTEVEYRSMAASPAPLARSRVWLLHSHEPRAHVSMGLATTLISQEQPPDLENTPENAGYAFAGVSTVVVFMLLAPPGAPEEMKDHLQPPVAASPLVRRAWPNPRPQYFPLGVLTDAAFAGLLDFPRQIFDAIGLPTVGLTDHDAATVYQAFIDGADPTELRRHWDRDTPQP